MNSAIRCRRAAGSAISEVGPAFFILLMCAFFPVLNVIWLGIDYFSASTLNDLQLREATRCPKSQALAEDGLVLSGIPMKWRISALAGGVDPKQDIKTSVSYHKGLGAIYVSVSTTVSFRPLLPIPFFSGIPGLGSPITFAVTGDRPLENQQFYFF